MSEQVTLQLVPWSCAVDDSSKPATLTCTPAYLQLSTEPGKQPLSLCCRSDQIILKKFTSHCIASCPYSCGQCC